MSESLPENRWRFSLADALGVTALLAVVAAPVSWLGEYYVAQASVSLLFLGWTALCVAKRWQASFVVSCLPALFVAAGLFSLAIFLQVVCTGFVLLITTPLRDRLKLRLAACAAVMIVAYAPTLTGAAASDRRVARMREAWPLVSIRERLPDVSHMKSTSEMTEEQERGLLAVEESPGQRFRRGELPGMLSRLHNVSYARFARMPGFGFSRMGPLNETWLASAADDLRPVQAGLPISVIVTAGGIEDGELHQNAAVQFLDRDRLGYFHSIDNVAGFVGHGFSQTSWDGFAGRRTATEESPSESWRLERLDLIGLMREDAPVAYVSETLPDMEQLPSTPTRPLNDFEREALGQLQADREVVVREFGDGDPEGHEPERVRMVGALRAADSCAACHDVARGTLLGAFSYELARAEPPDVTIPAQSRPSAGG